MLPERNGTKSVINHCGELVKLINKLAYKHGAWRVFEDFLGMAAISISNSVDLLHRSKREVEYMEIVGRYEHEDVNLFPQMMAHLVEELERHAESPHDVLGQIFHELELHNKYKGQFFTPQHICDFMGMVSLHENDPDIAKKGFVGLAEPCCGSGAMILGFAKAMYRNGYDFHRQMVVKATDIDIKCVHMCYLQLSLYGIPAVIIHGNSLAFEEWSRWYTPVYILDGWAWKQSTAQLKDTLDVVDARIPKTSDTTPKFYFTFEQEDSPKQIISAEQLTLFQSEVQKCNRTQS